MGLNKDVWNYLSIGSFNQIYKNNHVITKQVIQKNNHSPFSMGLSWLFPSVSNLSSSEEKLSIKVNNDTVG